MDEVPDITNCLSLIEKIRGAIPNIHKSCIQVDNLSLEDDLSKWQYMIVKLGIPTGSNLSLSSSSEAEAYPQILKALQPYKAVLETIKDRLPEAELVNELLADLGELMDLISMSPKHEDASQPPEPVQLTTTTPLSDYDIQVTTHVTLVMLNHIGQEVSRFFRSLQPSDP